MILGLALCAVLAGARSFTVIAEWAADATARAAAAAGYRSGEAAQQGEFADRQPAQAQPQQVVGLVRVLDEFLRLQFHTSKIFPEKL